MTVLIEYGFTRDGGFAAIDHDRDVAAYAYPTSIFCNRAHREADKVAREMISEESHWRCTGAAAQHYQHISAKLADANRSGIVSRHTTLW